ncbi:MAG: thiamine pyrophosphate-binding protein [Nitrososphaerota archaeon]|nr:thiamine pyrophosphate-binding protein [Nitrososphaerota archaeon]
MTSNTGGRSIGRALKRYGVKYAFNGISVDMSPLLDGLLREGIELINVRHEASAGYMAHGWSRATRGLGVCVGTGAVGPLNMATPIAASYYECSPVLAICGHSPYRQLDKGALHEFDAVRMCESFTKWARLCTDGGRFAEYVHIGVRNAISGRPGPVLLEFPSDLLAKSFAEQTEEMINFSNGISMSSADQSSIKRLSEMVAAAQRPVLLLGNGTYWSGASDAIQQLVEFARIPVVARGGQAQGCLPEDHPLCLGSLVLGRPNAATLTLQKADLVVAVGIRFEAMASIPVLAPDTKVVQIDILPSELGRNIKVDLGICSDANAAVTQLLHELKNSDLKKNTEWLKVPLEEKRKLEDSLNQESNSQSITSAILIKELRDFLPRDSWVILDGADVTAVAKMHIKAYLPGHILSSNGNLGNIGAGVPFSMGVKLANPDQLVLLLTGDGSFLFNSRELDTARRHGINILCVVGNDRAWGAEYHPMAKTFGVDSAEKMGGLLSDETRYDKYAEALGCYGELVTKPSEILPALIRARDSGKPSVLDVRLERKDQWPQRSQRFQDSIKLATV